MSQIGDGDSKQRILAVDDAAIILTRITNALQNDYEVITVNSGERALKYFVLESAKLGICDYILKPFYSEDLIKRICRVFEKEEEDSKKREEEDRMSREKRQEAIR